MREIEYRLECLKRAMPKFEKKRIALYGIAANAKAIINAFPKQNIITLIDETHIGQYRYGKKIVSLEDTLRLRIEVIIIAAEAISSEIVSKRIINFCSTHSILLLNMYGMDEEKIKEEILQQDILYTDFNERKLLQQIEEHEIVCFQLMDVLCASKYYKREELFEELENRCPVRNLAKYRIYSEKMMNPGGIYELKDIYDKYWNFTLSPQEDIQYILKQEESLFIQSIVKRPKMINILNNVFMQGKGVYIISDLYYSEELITELLQKIGVKNYHGIVQGNICGRTISDGALRFMLGEQLERQMLYIGTAYNYSLMIAQAYHMSICIVKDSWDMLWQFGKYEVCKTGNVKKDLWAWAQEAVTSPFVEDNQYYMKNIPLGDTNRNVIEQPALFPPVKYNNIQELETLIFPTYKTPRVSIIVPVYNLFEYTYNCLKAILYRTSNIEYEVIVADDFSEDDTVRINDVIKGIYLIRNKENLSFLRNCNHAAEKARGKYIVFLNNDTQVQGNWLEPLVRLLEEHYDIGMAGSKQLYPDGRVQEAGGIIWRDGTAFNYGRGENPNMPEYNYVREVDYITGASIIVRKALWNEIGGFDLRYVPAYCEDSDLAFEVRRYGKKVVYQPESVIVHFEGMSSGKEIKGIKSYQKGNSEKLREKWRKVLEENHYDSGENVFCARERKRNKKTILVIDGGITAHDQDTEITAIFEYMKKLLDKGYIVKYVPHDFKNNCTMQQNGIEVLYGNYYKIYFNLWLWQNQESIDYAFISGIGSRKQFEDILKRTSIIIKEVDEL